ncbi:hypothetical protein HYPSUDRAFT_148479 [Hypholoma sublateritium FD-334 SS-4]|uniref:Uncharacterized protein n=1 Tax=Hypholoma sublateritium (strain FD-334 SS-4) TaxID=945553 RepID=A0A0D2KMW0_HYPSF|nr:hypothetical protein HYPSUDRAFT_148479 [Hypholoma sublateritium FD-334 SS-4]
METHIPELPEKVISTKAKGKEKAKADAPQKVSHHRIRKLVPPRPFPTVPRSVSATGPRSSHREGKNLICLTRKSTLSNYMRRCKDIIIKDGYKTLHLSAMGAAIPVLLQLVTALPPILPFSKDEIRYEIKTRTVEAQDEIIPESEDDDISYQTRGKSVLDIVFKIGDGEFEGDRTAIRKYSAGKSVGKTYPPRNKIDATKKGKATEAKPAIVFVEPEQEFMDML